MQITEETVLEFIERTDVPVISEWLKKEWENFKTSKLPVPETQSQIVFTTKDGFDKYDGDKFWNVSDDFSLSEFKVDKEFATYEKGVFFHNKENALSWIIMNKPNLSIQNLMDMKGDAYGYIGAEYLISLAKKYMMQTIANE
jgi:hypothetical protein